MSYVIHTYRITDRITGAVLHDIGEDEIANALVFNGWFNVDGCVPVGYLDAILALQRDIVAGLNVAKVAAYLGITVTKDGSITITEMSP